MTARLLRLTPEKLAARSYAIGDAFVAGVVLYMGERSYTFEDRLHVMSVDKIWAP